MSETASSGQRRLTGVKISPKAFLMMAAPVVLVALGVAFVTSDPLESERARLRWKFSAPPSVPFPSSNVPSAARIALGQQLFHDKRLSETGTVACATCHDAAKGFSDGVAHNAGIAGKVLPMHSPTLWNLAWSNAFFWDGRSATLEAQARGPLENPLEMGSSVETAVEAIKPDKVYQAAFAAAFPEKPDINADTVTKALASYMRALVSPPTRFDQWITGQTAALNDREKNGFGLFIGKGGCVNCHSGWAFTDYAFHDIGLPSQARGRGHVIQRPGLNQAFKTPTLRELVWSAPYMHDGSLKTLEDVVRHYEQGGVNRPTRSPDMPRRIDLTAGERADLVAFLKALSSPQPPSAAGVLGIAVAQGDGKGGKAQMPRIGQRNKQFSLERVRIAAGQSISIVNDDIQPHNVFIQDPRMNYDSGWQQPGEQAQIKFDVAGDFQVYCGVHPNMRLSVEVEPVVTAAK